LKSSKKVGFFCFLLLLCFSVKRAPAQGALERETGFGEIEVGAPLSTLPFPCAGPVSCEAVYESVRVRLWHASGRIQRIDVLYSGKSAETGERIQSSPITLSQAVRSHSIRYGNLTPRLGFGGSYGGERILVDYANGIAYFADSAFVTSRVEEVRYLPMDDPLIISARASPLSEHGEWLMKEARFAPRYKNLLAEAERASRDAPGTGEAYQMPVEITHEEMALRLEKASSEARAYAHATLMLSARVLESMEKKETPDPLISARLRKAFARLNATTSEALCLVNHHPDLVTAQDRAELPLELAGEAKARMKELTSRGFVN